MAYRCTASFAFGSPPQVYAAGRLVGDDDPILSTHRALFEPVEAQVARQQAAPSSVTATETASAAPGETRDTDVARRRAAGRRGSEA